MTNSQRHTLRASEIRQRLNEIAGLEGDTFTDEVRAESDRLGVEYRDVETKLRAATVAEGDKQNAVDTTGEGAEIRQLQGKAELRRALHLVSNGSPLDGAERELGAARGITALNAVPWDLLDVPRSEHRAAEMRQDVATTDTSDIHGTSQNSIIRRVFSKSATSALGVSMESVPVGERNFPVFSAGAAAAFVAADGAKDAEAATFDPATLDPKRLQARYVFRREDLARVMGYEEALRHDLSGTMTEQLDSQNLAGDGVEPNLGGFLAIAANGGLAATTDDSDVVTFATAAMRHASGVDGRYAAKEKDISVVCGDDAYGVLAGIFHAGSGVSATSYAMSMLREFRASANIPARDATSKNQEAILARMAADDGEQNAVCPVWSDGVTLIRDEVTLAAKGQIAVTAVGLYSFAILRAAAYLRLKYRLAA